MRRRIQGVRIKVGGSPVEFLLDVGTGKASRQASRFGAGGSADTRTLAGIGGNNALGLTTMWACSWYMLGW